MKNVLLITLCDYNNFGNRLQEIALKNMVECLGYTVTCVSTEYYKNRSRLKSKIKQRIIKELGRIGIRRYRESFQYYTRVTCLKKTNKEYLQPIIGPIINYEIGDQIRPEEYVAGITGSDQVWHSWNQGSSSELPFYYLQFMPTNKRISYAASFGFDSIPEKDIEKHTIGLKGMNRVSCREESGCELVYQITGKRGKLVLDPTLCVDKEFWTKIEEKPDYKVPKRYIIMYILGEKDEYTKAIYNYAAKHELIVIDLFDAKRNDIWRTSIGGFIWLVHNAELICTDSFHCSVFGMLYEKPIQIFKRKGLETMFGRLETLTRITGMEELIYDDIAVKKINPDYHGMEERLKLMRDESVYWLRDALYDACRQ